MAHRRSRIAGEDQVFYDEIKFCIVPFPPHPSLPGFDIPAMPLFSHNKEFDSYGDNE